MWQIKTPGILTLAMLHVSTMNMKSVSTPPPLNCVNSAVGTLNSTMRNGRLESWRQTSKVNYRRDSFELWEVVASKVDVKLARRITAGTLLNYEKWSPQNAWKMRACARLTKYPRVKNARLKVFRCADARALTAKMHLLRAPGKIKNDRPDPSQPLKLYQCPPPY